MTSRFNTTNSLGFDTATEATLEEVRDLLSDGISVTISNVTASTNTDIKKINGVSLTGSTIPVSIIDNNTISKGSGTTDSTTQRVVLAASSQPELLVKVTENNTISKGSGITDATTQRVTVSTDQSALVVDPGYDKDQNFTTANTLRVALPWNVKTIGWDPVPVQQFKTYPNVQHRGSWITLIAADASNNYLWAQSDLKAAYSSTSSSVALASSNFLPTNADTDFYIYSTNLADTNVDGAGAKTVRVIGYNLANTKFSVLVPLAGVTPVIIGAAPLFRVTDLIVETTGVNLCNQGSIKVISGTTVGVDSEYPIVIPPKANKSVSALIYLPVRDTNAPVYNTLAHRLDYIQYQWFNESGTAPEELLIKTRVANSTIWFDQIRFYNNSNQFIKADLSNVRFLNTNAYDIAVFILKTNNVGTTYLSWSLGGHTE